MGNHNYVLYTGCSIGALSSKSHSPAFLCIVVYILCRVLHVNTGLRGFSIIIGTQIWGPPPPLNIDTLLAIPSNVGILVMEIPAHVNTLLGISYMYGHITGDWLPLLTYT